VATLATCICIDSCKAKEKLQARKPDSVLAIIYLG
jgi:hypothetical protein